MSDTWVTVVGIIVQTVLFLLGGYAMVVRNDVRTNNLADQLKAMSEELKNLAQVIVTQAVQTTRINNLAEQMTMLQRNMEDLRRGNGFVRGRGGVDGEYP